MCECCTGRVSNATDKIEKLHLVLLDRSLLTGYVILLCKDTDDVMRPQWESRTQIFKHSEKYRVSIQSVYTLCLNNNQL